MSILDAETKTRFEAITRRYPNRQAAVIPLLHLLQEKAGLLDDQAAGELADFLKMPASKVQEVISFYTMFTRKKRGKHHLMLCRTLSCALNGCPDLVQAVEEELGLKPGGVTSDGVFSLELVECLGACDLGCVVQVGEDIHPRMTADKVKELIRGLKG